MQDIFREYTTNHTVLPDCCAPILYSAEYFVAGNCKGCVDRGGRKAQKKAKAYLSFVGAVQLVSIKR
jgi:hypothetical protein